MAELDADYSLVHEQHFFQSLRASGYKSTSKAIAELVDNAIQANASVVSIRFLETTPQLDKRKSTRAGMVIFEDNGIGMDRRTLRQGLRIGGTERHGDRTGLGRFGMGLKNASFSQCRRLEVYTWNNGLTPGLYSYLDIDEIVAGSLRVVPAPTQIMDESILEKISRPQSTGTIVLWKNCDRLSRDGVVSTLMADIRFDLGRIFRKFIHNGRITINVDNTAINIFDPMFSMDGPSIYSGALKKPEKQFQVTGNGMSGNITVRLAVLPEEWQRAPEKLDPELQALIDRRYKECVGFSVLRNERELATGLYQIRASHHANQWWSGEICFSPELDELFGVTNTKQQVTIDKQLSKQIADAIRPIMIATVNEIESRRSKHQIQNNVHRSEEIASELESLLGTPAWLANRTKLDIDTEIDQFSKDNEHLPEIRTRLSNAHENFQPFVIDFESVDSKVFFRPKVIGRVIVVLINKNHAFYHRLYEPLCRTESASGIGCELLLVAFLKAFTSSSSKLDEMASMTNKWGESLATYLSADFLR